MPQLPYRILIAVGFLALLLVLMLLGLVPVWMLAWYVLASIVALGLYGFDKSAARNDRWRIQENTLQGVALAGGWPGALLGQELFRHKSSKTSFQMMFWVAVVVNCIVFIGFISW